MWNSITLNLDVAAAFDHASRGWQWPMSSIVMHGLWKLTVGESSSLLMIDIEEKKCLTTATRTA
jgi:hypothetical protein